MHLSVVNDEVPHNRLHDTNQLSAGNEWIDTYEGESETMLRTVPPITELPMKGVSGVTATVNISSIPPDHRYVYTEVAAETGIRTSGGLGLGDRRYVFLELNPDLRDNIIYSDGEMTVFQKNRT